MNYILQINGFRLLRKLRPIRASSIVLYYVLLENFNQVGFPETLEIPIATLSGESSLSLTTVRQARDELSRKGYILFTKGSSYTPSKYKLLELDSRMVLNEASKTAKPFAKEGAVNE